MQEIRYVDIVAWGAVVACIVLTIHSARVVKKQTRLFTSLTFFALSWAMLLPYYGLQERKEVVKGLGEVFELLPAYSGLLLTLAGGPLRREAVVRKLHRDPGVGEYDSWALTALYAIVLPHVIAVPGASEFLLKLHGQIIIIIGTLLTFLGFVSILQGLWKLTETDRFGRVVWWWLLLIIALCVLTEVGFTVHLLPNPDQPMSDFFKWAYAVFKVALTALVLTIIVRQKSHKAAFKEKRGEPQYVSPS